MSFFGSGALSQDKRNIDNRSFFSGNDRRPTTIRLCKETALHAQPALAWRVYADLVKDARFRSAGERVEVDASLPVLPSRSQAISLRQAIGQGESALGHAHVNFLTLARGKDWERLHDLQTDPGLIDRTSTGNGSGRRETGF